MMKLGTLAVDMTPMRAAGQWKEIFERYTRLERSWSVPGAPSPVAHQFFRQIVHAHHSAAQVSRELRSFRLEPPSSDLLDEAFFLQRTLFPDTQKRPGGRHPDDPMEDVYAAALSMLPYGFWVESPDREQLYRGQRDHRWDTIPKLFRQADVDAALAELSRAVPRIRACLPGATDDEAVAVAQHYSNELGVATWLLDVTYDPRVALFFASDGGLTGDIGVVACVVQREWNALSANGTNRLGPLRVVDVASVPRIANQRASFLDTSHPRLFEQYVAHQVWFRQVSGLRFEDPLAAFPVTADRIYPADDPIATALLAAPAGVAAPLAIGPAADARQPLGSEEYWQIAQSWCHEAGVDIDAYREDTLRVICDVHARLHSECATFGIADRSLARLEEAVNFVIEAQRAGTYVSPHEAMRWSLSRLPPEKQDRLSALIKECAKARDLC